MELQNKEDYSSDYKDSVYAQSKVEELSKLDESYKLMNHPYSQQTSSYQINRQGADNRRNLFEQLKVGHLSKELSDISGNLDQDRWEEMNDELKSRKASTFKKDQYQNLEVQVSSSKKMIDSTLINFSKMVQARKNDGDWQAGQSPIEFRNFFEQRYQNGIHSEENQVEFDRDKERNGTFQDSSSKVIRQNSPINFQDTPGGRSSAKARRQTHIALKMKGLQNSAGVKTPLDDISRSSANSLTNNNIINTIKQTKAQQNQIVNQIAQTIPTSANQSNLVYKDNELQQLNQVEDKTILQDEDNYIEQHKKQHLIILTYMKRFINQLLKRLSYKKFDLLAESHLQMIGDPSIPPQIYKNIIKNQKNQDMPQLNILARRRYQYDNNILKNKCGRRQSFFFFNLKRQLKENAFLSQFMCQIPIFHPQSLFLIAWELLLLCILFFYLIFTPLKTSFEFDLDEHGIVFFFTYKIPVFIFLADIFLGFQTGYYELGRVVKERKLIAIRYIQKKFITDLICTLMMTLNNFIIFSNFIEILTLVFRINQMKAKMAIINDHFRIQNRYPTMYEMIKTASFILYMSHVCGCGFHLIGTQAPDGNSYSSRNNDGQFNRNWIEDQGLEHTSWQTRYVFSVYFAIMTMITVGYGDIFPINIYEKLYVIGMTVITCGVFAYCVNSISSIFSQLSQKSSIFKQKQYDLVNYMNQKNIKMDTQTKIMKYLDYLEEESDQCIAKGESVLSSFPIELREQLMREYFVKILLDVPILHENFSLAFLNAVSLKMKEKRLGPGEKILIKNERLSQLQFITKGSIEYSIEDGDYQRAICSVQSEKSVIDFRLFLTCMKSNISMQCITMTNVAYISYQDFIEELKRFHKDYEKFCYLRDQFLNDGRFEKICPSCNHYGHEIYNCPQVHYSVNRSIFSQKVFYSQQQTRQQNPIERAVYKRVSWRNIYHEAKNDLKYIRWAYIIEQYDLYNQINIDDQIKVIESDKSFFKRCPKLKPDLIKMAKSLYVTKNLLDVIIEEGSANSLTNSEQSNFQTDYTETQYNYKGRQYHRKLTNQQDEDIIDSLHTDQGQVQNISINTEKIIPDQPNCHSLSSLFQEIDVKIMQDSPKNVNNPQINSNTNMGTNKIKSEASIKRQESLNKPMNFNSQQNQSQQQSIIRQANRRLTNDLTELELNRKRRQSRHLTNKSIAQMIKEGQIQVNIEKQQTHQNSFISYQQDKYISQNSSLSNSMNGYVGPLGNVVSSMQQINVTQDESIRQLDQMVEKFKRQCIKMMTKTFKLDYLTLPSNHHHHGNNNNNSNSINNATNQNNTNSFYNTNSRDDNSKIMTLSKNSKLVNRNGTLISVTNTMQRSEKTIQEIPQKKKSTDKELISQNRNYLRNHTLLQPSNHIFGVLQFKFDKMREYQIYYPKGNAFNIIKIYKKIQQQRLNAIKLQNLKGRQSIISDHFVSFVQLEKHGQSVIKRTNHKMSRMSHISNMEIKNNNNIINL